MGLDVFLCHANDWDAAMEIYQARHEFNSGLYRFMDTLPPDSKKNEQIAKYLADPKIHKKFGAYLVPEKDGTPTFIEPAIESYEEPSKKHPDCYFQVGYFRSSYNESGINNVMETLDLPGLYEIFDVMDSSDYYLEVDWQNAKTNIVNLLSLFQPLAKNYGLINTTRFFKDDAVRPRGLLESVIKELDKQNDGPFDSYSCGGITYFLNGLKVVAHCGNWLVYESDEKDGGLKNYLEELEVVEETIDFVLNQPHPDHWRLAWSA